jgi:hypothetical protein
MLPKSYYLETERAICCLRLSATTDPPNNRVPRIVAGSGTATTVAVNTELNREYFMIISGIAYKSAIIPMTIPQLLLFNCDKGTRSNFPSIDRETGQQHILQNNTIDLRLRISN